MKLHFNKNDKNDIIVQIEKGTTIIDFNYVEMLMQLIVDNNIECDWGNLDSNERTKLQELLDKIKIAVETGIGKALE